MGPICLNPFFFFKSVVRFNSYGFRDVACSVALFSSDEKGRLFVPDAEEKRCTIVSSKSGKLIDIDVGAVKAAVGKLLAESLVPA